jgi:hypothetical protein
VRAGNQLKDVFPETMSSNQIEMAILEAYRRGKRIQTDGNLVQVQGQTTRGLLIEMWVNLKTRIIETAYPTKP